MRVAILHDSVSGASSPDIQDTIVQVEAVTGALKSLGHEMVAIPCSPDIEAIRARLGQVGPDLVFNLVESLDGHGRLIHVVPSLLDAWAVPYTGSSSEALFVTSNKLLAKEWLRAAGLPALPSMTTSGIRGGLFSGETRWIVKSVWEHASIGMDDGSVVEAGAETELAAVLELKAGSKGGECFAEPYVEGREFNVALLAGPDGPEVLPIAEIVFDGYPQGKPRIVGYSAKWDEGSYEYVNTPRRFDFEPSDRALLDRLARLSLRCWQAFGLGGHVRVDFRVDAQGKPWILEVNTNPCLSPDAGFAAMLERAGMPFTRAIERILDDALARRSPLSRPASQARPASPVAAGRSETPARPATRDGVAFGDVIQHGAIEGVTFRQTAGPGDPEAIRELVAATGFFYEWELPVAAELVQDVIDKGDRSDYRLVVAELDGRIAGYSCFGRIACTQAGWDLYWLAVRPGLQGKGLGMELMRRTHEAIRKGGGTHVYAETSGKAMYEPTNAFYEKCGYRVATVIDDFYAPGDPRITYIKVLGKPT